MSDIFVNEPVKRTKRVRCVIRMGFYRFSNMALSRLVTLSIDSLRNLDIESNKFYNGGH